MCVCVYLLFLCPWICFNLINPACGKIFLIPKSRFEADKGIHVGVAPKKWSIPLGPIPGNLRGETIVTIAFQN